MVLHVIHNKDDRRDADDSGITVTACSPAATVVRVTTLTTNNHYVTMWFPWFGSVRDVTNIFRVPYMLCYCSLNAECWPWSSIWSITTDGTIACLLFASGWVYLTSLPCIYCLHLLVTWKNFAFLFNLRASSDVWNIDRTVTFYETIIRFFFVTTISCNTYNCIIHCRNMRAFINLISLWCLVYTV